MRRLAEGGSHARAVLVLPLVLVGLVAACAKPVDHAGCRTAPPELLQRLQEHLVVGGEVSHAVVLEAPGDAGLFVSFENRTERQVERDRPGHILTLATRNLSSGELSAVDEWAKKETDLPQASVSLKAPSAVESRGCVAARRAE